MNIFDKYYTWKSTRQKAKAKKHRIAGYDWALGALSRGEITPSGIDALTYDIEHSSFESGMDDAIDYMLKHNLIEDDRF